MSPLIPAQLHLDHLQPSPSVLHEALSWSHHAITSSTALSDSLRPETGSQLLSCTQRFSTVILEASFLLPGDTRVDRYPWPRFGEFYAPNSSFPSLSPPAS